MNATTIKTAWPFLRLDYEVLEFSRNKVFPSIYFVSDYWQLPVEPGSYHACGILCPPGEFDNNRAFRGLTNATTHFQSTVEPLFRVRRQNMMYWLGDFNLHEKEENFLLQSLQAFFGIFDSHNLFLSAKKFCFLANEIKWCGRLINCNGFKMDPSNISAFKAIKLPVTAYEFCQFVHCCRLMSISLPNFAQMVAPLDEIFEKLTVRVEGKLSDIFPYVVTIPVLGHRSLKILQTTTRQYPQSRLTVVP